MCIAGVQSLNMTIPNTAGNAMEIRTGSRTRTVINEAAAMYTARRVITETLGGVLE